MDESLRPQKSRITIFDEPVICQLCANDVFIPYEFYLNVEQPGIGVKHVRYVAICQHCGKAKFFGDPSNFDAETGKYIWALNQYLLSIRKYQVKITIYVGKRKKDKMTTFINKLKQQFELFVMNINDYDGEVVFRIKLSSLNDSQSISHSITYSANLLKITIKDITIK